MNLLNSSTHFPGMRRSTGEPHNLAHSSLSPFHREMIAGPIIQRLRLPSTVISTKCVPREAHGRRTRNNRKRFRTKRRGSLRWTALEVEAIPCCAVAATPL